MKRHVDWQCPYCGISNTYVYDDAAEQPDTLLPSIATCDIEEGGCDEYVALDWDIEITCTPCRLVPGARTMTSC